MSSISLEDTDPDGWYTIGGIRSLAGPTQSGIYIHNGQKVAIR
jgi:hypothetical protein